MSDQELQRQRRMMIYYRDRCVALERKVDELEEDVRVVKVEKRNLKKEIDRMKKAYKELEDSLPI